MKRYLTLIITLLLVTNIHSQTQDSICFPKDRVLRISNEVKTLQKRDSLNKLIINNWEHIHTRDSIIIETLDYKIKGEQPKWYESPKVNFILGILTVILTLEVLQ